MSDERNTLETSNTNCEKALELIPAYCIGAADKEERQFVEAMLDLCPELATELESYHSLAQALLFSAPPVQPPPHLEANLLRAIAPKPEITPPTHAVERDPSILQKLVAVFFGPNRGYSPLLAAVAVALFMLSNIYWIVQLGQIRGDQQMLSQQVAEQRILLRKLGSDRVNRVELASQANGQAGYGSLVWADGIEANTWIAVLNVQNLPALSVEMAYQLWLIRDGVPVSAGVFRVDETGDALYIFRTQEPIGLFESVGITREPAQGSLTPTSPVIAIGQI